jgi:hypothetical protein
VKDRSDAILQSAQAAYLERLLPPRDALPGAGLLEVTVWEGADCSATYAE